MNCNYRGANNCTFCNAAKTRTITKTKGQRVDRTNFCEECFDEMQAFNDRMAAKEDQERIERGTIGSSNILTLGGQR